MHTPALLQRINQIIPIFIHNRFFLTYSFYPTFSTDACKKNGAVTRATTQSGVLNVYQTSMQPLCAPLTSQKLCTFFFSPSSLTIYICTQIPKRYPFEPPHIKFATPIYHPNVDSAGKRALALPIPFFVTLFFSTRPLSAVILVCGLF